MDRIINRYKKIALSDSEVLDLMNGRANIVLYPDIYKYDTLDEMLGPDQAAIILFESKPNFGHWVSIFRNDNDVTFFNSYSGYPDDTLKFIDKQFKMSTNQDKPYLSLLMLNSPYKLHYNEFKFQRHGGDINTCGRWAALRLIFRTLNCSEFHSLIVNLSKMLNIGFDNLATLLTMWINK